MTEPQHPRRLPVAARAAATALAALGLLAGCATAPLPPTPEGPLVAAPAAAASAPATPLQVQPPVAAASAPADTVVSAVPEPQEPVEAGPEVRDPLRPDVRLDFDDDGARADLWARVRRGFAMPDLEGERVRNWQRWYASRPDYVQRMTERGARYLFHIVEELDKRGMPAELALLPFIESAFNPEAMSSARASGMWQFIPSTGRNFDLKQNLFRDERRDVLASTRAALDYLTKLYGMFGDWQLALAAYNWGEGSVQRAIERNRRQGRRTDYASLRMPRETANYLPKLQAVKNIVARPDDFGLELPALANHPYFVAVPIERDIDVEIAVRLAGMELDDFKALNPQMNKPVILAAGTPQLLLPYDNANLFVKSLAAHRGALAHWTAWVAPKTLRAAEAARMVGTDEQRLREVNHIPQHMMIKAGSTLLVPRDTHGGADVPEHVADNATLALAAEPGTMRRIVLKAGRKDSVASIARRHGVAAAQLAQWNGMGPSTHFKPGQTIVIYRAVKPPPARVTKASRPVRTARHGSAGGASAGD